MKTKGFIIKSAIILVVSIIIGLFIRSKDVKTLYYVIDNNNQKKEISFEYYTKLEASTNESNRINFLYKETSNLNKNAFIYGGSYFVVLMVVITIIELIKEKTE